MLLGEFDGFALAFNDIAGFAFEWAEAVRAAFDFVFIHLNLNRGF